MRHLDEIKKERRRTKSLLTMSNSKGNLVQNAKKIGALDQAYLAIYLEYAEEMHLKISTYNALRETNRNSINILARAIKHQVAKEGISIAFEAHHFIPARLYKRWELFSLVYKNQGDMPAVNITNLEHLGSKMIFAELMKEGQVLPGVIGKPPLNQDLMNVTDALEKIIDKAESARETRVKKLGRDLTLGEQRDLTLNLMDDLSKCYQERFPDIWDKSQDFGGNKNWKVSDWFRETRKAIETIPL